MTGHQLTLHLGTKRDLEWCQHKAVLEHYLHGRVDPRARPHCYVIKWARESYGMVMVGIPHATRCGGWWGYDGLPTQWQVVDMSRIWISPLLQQGGRFCRPGVVPGFIDRKGVWRPAVASWAIHEVLSRVQEDRISLWPPVFPHLPYHIRLVISYSDPRYHRGTIYKAAGAEPLYTDNQGNPRPGPAGKYGWCWRLPEPGWSYQDIVIRQPRTMRLILPPNDNREGDSGDAAQPQLPF